MDGAEALSSLHSDRAGLSHEEAERRLAEHGSNSLAQDEGETRLSLLARAFLNPLVLLLTVLATVSYLTHDVRAALVMGVMVVLGVSLIFFQEARADTAAKKLRAMIRSTATVLRDGAPKEVPLADPVPGDVVNLTAGDMIPADIRLLSAKDLFVVQGSLTGSRCRSRSSTDAEPTAEVSALELRNICFLGDGINDGPALRAADVGISVDSAADIAKESADLILLEKSLMILDEGILEGRKVFANILKYIRMEPARASAKCSAWWAPAPSCRSCPWLRCRS